MTVQKQTGNRHTPEAAFSITVGSGEKVTVERWLHTNTQRIAKICIESPLLRRCHPAEEHYGGKRVLDTYTWKHNFAINILCSNDTRSNQTSNLI